MHRLVRPGLVAAFLLGTALPATASSVLLMAGRFENRPAVSLTVPAQYLVFRLAVSSPLDSAEEQLREVQAARNLLAETAAKNGWKFKTDQVVVVTDGYRKFSSFSSDAGELEARARPLLLVELGESGDTLALVRRVRQLVERTSVPKKVRVQLEGFWVGIESPERFRAELLRKIRAHLDATVDALGSGLSLEISGLDEPLMAQQIEERLIELSLPLRVVYTRPARAQ